VSKYHTEQEAETSIEHRFQLINTPVNIAVCTVIGSFKALFRGRIVGLLPFIAKALYCFGVGKLRGSVSGFLNRFFTQTAQAVYCVLVGGGKLAIAFA
jgi:hypothetical protein